MASPQLVFNSSQVYQRDSTRTRTRVPSCKRPLPDHSSKTMPPTPSIQISFSHSCLSTRRRRLLSFQKVSSPQAARASEQTALQDRSVPRFLTDDAEDAVALLLLVDATRAGSHFVARKNRRSGGVCWPTAISKEPQSVVKYSRCQFISRRRWVAQALVRKRASRCRGNAGYGSVQTWGCCRCWGNLGAPGGHGKERLTENAGRCCNRLR